MPGRWTEAGIEAEMIYGSFTDNDSMHSKDRYRNYGQTKSLIHWSAAVAVGVLLFRKQGLFGLSF